MIEDFWLTDKNRLAASWTSHWDINMVMLATFSNKTVILVELSPIKPENCPA